MICVPIIAKTTEEAFNKISRANALADVMEFRLDLMESFRLEDMLRWAAKPAIVTYRSEEQGGKGRAGYEAQTRYLLGAMEMGAAFIDVEYTMPPEFRGMLFQARNSSKLIISRHHLNGTPSREKLEEDFRNLAATGAHIIKIVTLAAKAEDNFRVMDLMRLARNPEINIAAFCMGPIGRLSRIASPLLGGYLTFASLEDGEESADGQIPVTEMRNMMKSLTS